ncbi:MAG: four helix bundle protein [Patescibacteria group bacterium]|nr:four helix bundle protein [Patescibacteria group bacterium]MBU2508833.1 four helix bundle protein [Patescibacteria group bacterium]
MNTIVLQKSCEIYSRLNRLIGGWPKRERYNLGLRLETSCLVLLEQIVSAEQTVPVLKDHHLLDAGVKTEVIKILLRMSVERQLIKETNYFSISSNLVEIGKMIGGWRKSLRK